MGRFESLTTWALGRSPYEAEVVRTSGADGINNNQQYNSQGRPRRPETRRRERVQVRAANEVVSVTGLVEDHRQKNKESTDERLKETFAGLRLIEVGRGFLVGGTWGALGLRRRTLLYRSYSEIGFLGNIQQEIRSKSLRNILFSGSPVVAIYHISDYVGFMIHAIIDKYYEDNYKTPSATSQESWARHILQTTIDLGFCFLTLHLRMFALLKQMDLLPASRHLPSLKSFIPFSKDSPLLFPPRPSLSMRSLAGWGGALFFSAYPMLIILFHGRFRFFLSKLLYRPIYKCLPRPQGASMFAGLDLSPPGLEYDTPDRPVSRAPAAVGEDAETLRALEGRPPITDDFLPVEQRELQASTEIALSESSEDGEWTGPQTAFSLDVEANLNTSTSGGMWSAELRSAGDPKDATTKYRVTGLTMLPTILAAEGLREIIVSILVLPIETSMVRVIGRSYLDSAGYSTVGLYLPADFKSLIPLAGKLFGVYAIQTLITSAVWAGYTIAVQLYMPPKSVNNDKEQDS